MKTISVNNFRCYENMSIEFRPGINLLIGDNSSGKTSLVRACNFVANAFFCGFSDENTSWKSVDDSDFRLIVGDDNTILPWQPVSIEFTLSENDCPPILKPDGSVCEIDLQANHKLQKNSPKNNRNLKTGVAAYAKYCSALYDNSHISTNGSIQQLNALPLYACFTTEDIHSLRKINRENFLKYTQKPSFGYNECYDCRGLFDYWLKRLLVLQEAETGIVEINTVKKALRDALGPEGCNIIDDIVIRPMRGKVYFHFSDGRLVESGMLSDGYKRLVNIVVDIAMRCALLNKSMYGDECYKHTRGTVIIDEIDEHLHPEIQRRILKDLHRTFPEIQFIVTTHAPMVISSVENNDQNVVYRLWYDRETGRYEHIEIQAYGLDANSILESTMDVDSRDETVLEQLNNIQQLVSERRLEEAKRLLTDLETLTQPGQPVLVKIRSVINRLESRQ